MQVEEALLDIDGIETVQVSIGSSGSALRDAFSGGARDHVLGHDRSRRRPGEAAREVQDAIADLDDVGDVAVAASGRASDRATSRSTSPRSERRRSEEATAAVVDELDGRDGIGQVTEQPRRRRCPTSPWSSTAMPRPQRGLSEVAVGAIVSNTMRPQQLGSVEIDDTALTVYLAASRAAHDGRRAEGARRSRRRSASCSCRTSRPSSERNGPTSITTERGQRTATITVHPGTDDLAAATASVNDALADGRAAGRRDAEVGGVARSRPTRSRSWASRCWPPS